MAFTALHQAFGAVGRGISIQRMEDGAIIGHLMPEASMPVPVEQFAANLAALFNGNNPIYRFGGAHEMYYTPMGAGMQFRFRDVAAPAVSEAGAIFVASAGFEDVLGARIAQSPEVWANFMGACRDERRAEIRVEAAGRTPKPGGMVPPVG